MLKSKPTALLALLVCAAPAAGQRAPAASSGAVWFPRDPLFRPPLAAPHSPRFAGAFVITDILSHDSPERSPFPVNAPSARELMAVVNLGGAYPVVRTPWGKRLVEVGLEVGMDTRFRMKLPQRDMFSADWMVALPVTAAEGPWAWRLRAIHRSSHMGDQFEQATGAHRIQLGNDGFDVYGSRRWGPLRAYAGGEWIAYTETDMAALPDGAADRWQAQAGLEADWHAWAHQPALSVVGGADWESAQRSGWLPSLGLEGGLQYRQGPRSARLVVRAFNGASEVYQFFRTKETFYGLELAVTP